MLDVTQAPAPAAPKWLTLLPDLDPPVRVQVRAATRADRMAARAAGGAATRLSEDGFEGHVTYVMTLAQRVILAWEGVGDAAGQPVEPTRDEVIVDPESGQLQDIVPGTISNLMNGVDAAYEAFERQYVTPLLIAEQAAQAEKKGSLPSRRSSRAGAKKTAGSAGRSTAKPARAVRSKSTNP